MPIDTARMVQCHNLKSAVCVPVKLNAVMVDDAVLASEQVLGTISLASEQSRGVTSQYGLILRVLLLPFSCKLYHLPHCVHTY